MIRTKAAAVLDRHKRPSQKLNLSESYIADRQTSGSSLAHRLTDTLSGARGTLRCLALGMTTVSFVSWSQTMCPVPLGTMTSFIDLSPAVGFCDGSQPSWIARAQTH